MAEQPVVVQKISWSDLCPWTVIFKSLPIASSVTVLVFALLGVVLTPMGWLLSESLCISEELKEETNLMRVVQVNRSPYRGVFLSTEVNSNDGISILGTRFSGPKAVFSQFVGPFEYLFSNNLTLGGFLYFLIGCLWSISSGHLSDSRSLAFAYCG